ncbi:MAG TPA: hypothetical protein VGJ41_03820 [Nocardioides sp.]|jgi:hypothetical protein
MTTGIRGATAALLGLVACVLVPLAVVSVWFGQQITDTDGYVDAVAPLADNPVVREAATDQVENAVNSKFRVSEANQPIVHVAVGLAIDGPEFPPVWRTANRTAHERLMAILEDRSGRDEVSIDLRPVAQQVVAGLGRTGAVKTDGVRVPPIPVTLARTEQLEQAQAGYQRMEPVRPWVPIACVALLVLTLVIARSRLRAGAWLGFGSALALGLTWLGLIVARREAITRIPSGDDALAGEVWDALTKSLHGTMLNLIVAGLVVGVALLLVDRLGLLRGRRADPA